MMMCIELRIPCWISATECRFLPKSSLIFSFSSHSWHAAAGRISRAAGSSGANAQTAEMADEAALVAVAYGHGSLGR